MYSVIATNIAWWRHQMETFSALLAICAGNSPATSEFPSQKASDVKTRRLWDRLIFVMGSDIFGKDSLCIETPHITVTS